MNFYFRLPRVIRHIFLALPLVFLAGGFVVLAKSDYGPHAFFVLFGLILLICVLVLLTLLGESIEGALIKRGYLNPWK